MDDKSRALFDKACQLIPGGVNSPVRACHNVDSLPLFIAEAHGSHIIDVDGREYIDFILSWGPMILGHDHPAVTAAVREAAGRGTSYGAPCPDEVTLAEEVVADMPTLDMVRMVNSGTEATMSALRLARGVTGRDKVVKFIGCYHGHADPFLAAAGSGVATFAIPGTRARLAGQITGTEGYVEAIASGLLAALNVYAELSGLPSVVLPVTGSLGSLVAYATDPETQNYQPMHVNFGLFPPLENPPRNKEARRRAFVDRARGDLREYLASRPELLCAGTDADDS